MDKLIIGASFKGTYHIKVWFPKRQEVGAKNQYLQKKLGKTIYMAYSIQWKMC